MNWLDNLNAKIYNVWDRKYFIIKCNGSFNNYEQYQWTFTGGTITTGATIGSFRKPVFMDLTELFGEGNEPTTLQGLANKWGLSSIKAFKYTPYNLISLKHTQCTSLKTTGKNLVNQSMLDSFFSSHSWTKIGDNEYTGSASKLNSYLIFDNICGTTSLCLQCKIKSLSDNGSVFLIYKDNNTVYFAQSNNGNYINHTNVVTNINFINMTYYSDVQTWIKDFCVSVSNTNSLKGPVNGEYIPYKEHTMSLEQIMSNYFPDGLKSAGSVYDEITPTKVIKRCVQVNITGNEGVQWGYWIAGAHTFFFFEFTME